MKTSQFFRAFSNSMARFYASEIVCALEYIHSLGIVRFRWKQKQVLILVCVPGLSWFEARKSDAQQRRPHQNGRLWICQRTPGQVGFWLAHLWSKLYKCPKARVPSGSLTFTFFEICDVHQLRTSMIWAPIVTGDTKCGPPVTLLLCGRVWADLFWSLAF